MTTSERPDTQLSIGELARCAGITSRAVRHYHATGLLPEPPRDTSGYRRYGPGDLVRLVHICRLRALGTPTDQIERMLEDAPDAGTDLPAALHALAVDIEAEIDRLQGVHDRLVTLAASGAPDDAAELLSAGLKAGGLLDLDRKPEPVHPEDEAQAESFADDRTAQERADRLVQRFRVVEDEGVERLAQDLAGILPPPGLQTQSLDLAMTDRHHGHMGNGYHEVEYSDDRLNRAQRDCMLRLGTLLQARSHTSAERVALPL